MSSLFIIILFSLRNECKRKLYQKVHSNIEILLHRKPSPFLSLSLSLPLHLCAFLPISLCLYFFYANAIALHRFPKCIFSKSILFILALYSDLFISNHLASFNLSSHWLQFISTTLTANRPNRFRRLGLQFDEIAYAITLPESNQKHWSKWIVCIKKLHKIKIYNTILRGLNIVYLYLLNTIVDMI